MKSDVAFNPSHISLLGSQIVVLDLIRSQTRSSKPGNEVGPQEG